jgi:hypothetical protein
VLWSLVGWGGLHSGCTGSFELRCWWILQLVLLSYLFCLLDHFANLLLILPQQWLLWFVCDWLVWIICLLTIYGTSAGVARQSLVHVLCRPTGLTGVPLLQHLGTWLADLCILKSHSLVLIPLAWDWPLLLLYGLERLLILRRSCFSARVYHTSVWRWSSELTPLAVLAATSCFLYKSLRFELVWSFSFSYLHEVKFKLFLSFHLVLILSGLKNRLGFLLVSSSALNALCFCNLSCLQMTWRHGDLTLPTEFHKLVDVALGRIVAGPPWL